MKTCDFHPGSLSWTGPVPGPALPPQAPGTLCSSTATPCMAQPAPSAPLRPGRCPMQCPHQHWLCEERRFQSAPQGGPGQTAWVENRCTQKPLKMLTEIEMRVPANVLGMGPRVLKRRGGQGWQVSPLKASGISFKLPSAQATALTRPLRWGSLAQSSPACTPHPRAREK